MPFKTVKSVAAAIAGAVVVSGLAVAYASWGTWDLPGQDCTIEVEHEMGIGGNGPLTNLKVHRGAISSGSHPMDFVMTIAAVGVLQSAVLQTCTDADSDGVLEESEWTTVATASISVSGGVTTASTTPVNVSASLDGYRVWYVRSDIGDSWEIWKNNPSKTLE